MPCRTRWSRTRAGSRRGPGRLPLPSPPTRPSRQPGADRTRSGPFGDRTGRRSSPRSERGAHRGRGAAPSPRRPIPRTPCGRRRTPRAPRCRASRRSRRSSTRSAGCGSGRWRSGARSDALVSMVCPMAHEACHAVYRGGGTIRCIVFIEGNVRRIGRHRHREGPDGRGWQEDRAARRTERQQEEPGPQEGRPARRRRATATKKGRGHKKNVRATRRASRPTSQGHIVARNTHARAPTPATTLGSRSSPACPAPPRPPEGRAEEVSLAVSRLGVMRCWPCDQAARRLEGSRPTGL